MATIHCMWCGGANCKWENWELYKNLPNTHIAIEGVYSTWVTDSILATARPSSRYIKSHRIVEQFVEKGVKAIVNLQLPGEHALCGDGLQPGGFSYRPEEFMDAGVHFYNFGWTDMTTPTLDLALSAVQVVCYVVSTGGKVAVHCHAGLGRTGLIIACSLLSMGMSINEAIRTVRLHRRGSIQTKRQEEFISRFGRYLHELRIVFAIPKLHHSFSLEKAIRRQRRYLHGDELRRFGFAPKLLCQVQVCIAAVLDGQPPGGAEPAFGSSTLDRTYRSQSMPVSGPFVPLLPPLNRDNSPHQERLTESGGVSPGSFETDLLLADLNDILASSSANFSTPRGTPRRHMDELDGSLPSLRAASPASKANSVRLPVAVPPLGPLTTPRGSFSSQRSLPGLQSESTALVSSVPAGTAGGGRPGLSSSGFASPRNNGSPRGSITALPAIPSPPLSSPTAPRAWSPRSEPKTDRGSSLVRPPRPLGPLDVSTYPERRRSADLGQRPVSPVSSPVPPLPGAVDPAPTPNVSPEHTLPAAPGARRLARKASVELATVTVLDIASTVGAMTPQNSDEFLNGFNGTFESTASFDPLQPGGDLPQPKTHRRSASDSAVEVNEALPLAIKLPPLKPSPPSSTTEWLPSSTVKQDTFRDEGPLFEPTPPWLDITLHLQHARDKQHRLDFLKAELNADRWDVLNRERDCWLLFLLAMDWLEHFKEPVVNAGTMDYLLKCDDATLIFNALPKSVAFTLGTLITIVETMAAGSSKSARSQLFSRVAASLLKHHARSASDLFLRTKHSLETEKLGQCLEQAADLRWKPRTRLIGLSQ
eukprot:TRINITY_DN27877_c0_g1_i1.p1 TRINITY_DN27877_c0_g1~~TRINITY_DN27877_c0_g1_i1.p1  ORF type:complete len:818 (+),score=25.11 TRINITY_DN27877_c0_g1_i1:498-2951(+)